MEEWIVKKLESLKEGLKKAQEIYKINVKNIESPTYEDNTINDLLTMKEIKTEIKQLELVLELLRAFSMENK